jgi:HD-GYP domain-containing protein (c-di-GMP phosphodiesterase class II)
VADLSAMVAAQLGCPDEEVEAVRTAGRLHDIGKIGIREDILNKQGPLTDEEYEHVKQHTLVGSQILAPLVHLRSAITYVRGHHERWAGFGYPDRLAGDAIPLGARIIGGVEIYDALTTARPYQEKMPPEMAVERMRDLVGTAIDPSIHGALDAVVTRRQALVFLDDPQA